MIRVLHVIGAMNRAGAETFLMNLYRSIDITKVQFDFLVHTNDRCDYDQEVEQLGGRIFHVPRYTILNGKKYAEAIRSILKEHPEDAIVHSHIGSSALAHLKIAREEGRFTIAHSHNNDGKISLENLIFKAMAYPVRGKADYYMACSPEAGLDRFGQKITNQNNYSIIYNGIKVEEFHRDEDSIKQARSALDLDGHPVFGHIGRLTVQKNQRFLLDVFSEIHKQLPTAKLLLIGKGEDERLLHEKALKLGIGDSVLFLGIREDIPQLLRAMDVFVFPSTYEGLGVAIIEAQATGLQCVASSEIHDIAIASDRVVRLPLGDSETWASECVAAYARSQQAIDDCIPNVIEAGFDITNTARWLEDFYLSHSSS